MRQNFLRKTVVKLKPWGREIWFAWTSEYAGKILEIKKGHRFSLQYHEKKWESQYVVSGKVKFTYGENPKKLRTKILKKGDKVDIPARSIHRAEALVKTILFEVSSPELDDVTKLEDDYGRTGKGNNEKLDRRLSEN
jgi:mannose-6-phosphate isomerase-like protein (cupin superfamily)